MVRLETGDTGVAVTADSDGALYSGMFGVDNYVVATGNKFKAEIQSNNKIKISDGSAIMNGRHIRVPAGDSELVTINNGSQGMNRIDLIALRYKKELTGVESGSLVVIQGEETASEPKAPDHVKGDILTGATQADFPLYEVKLEGINITDIKPLFQTIGNITELEKKFAELNGKITEQNTLWDGFLYMQGGQEVKLSTPIDQTKSGIVLVFSFVENEKAQDYAWHSFFVPKALVESRPGDGHQFNLFWNTWSQKYLYIHNDKIVGQPTNSNTQNKRFGLRKIIAV